MAASPRRAPAGPRLRALAPCALLALGLAGCGGDGGHSSTSSTSTTTTTSTSTTTRYPLYACKTSVEVNSTVNMTAKGLCMDDTTFWHCADQVPGRWPNTREERVGSLRLFKAWNPSWGDDAARHRAWAALARWAAANDAKILLGAEVTCDAEADDRGWAWNLELARILRGRILGVAVGNEMDIWWRRGSQKCIDELWNGRYWATLQRRVQDLDSLGMNETKVTIVWAMSVLGGNPWKEDGQAKVNTLVTQAYKKWGDRWVWSFNVYSIWDVNLWPTSAKDCGPKTMAGVHIDYTKAILRAARQRIKVTTGRDDDPMWVGENGWSSPMPDGHPKFPFCPDYDSLETFKVAYESFMSWDLSIGAGLVGPEHAFYFTMRDAYNAGAKEAFGLIAACGDARCKIRGPGREEVFF
mmetsp:Transcript_2787/g.8293  ORF Transcript_2787/g.8293 Transcript_2787/m.8293 type:complete len:411 (-) Transcript_2787:50-1282(-)